MRVLLLMRGAPGCGKSTWIKKYNLEAFTLSPDDMRINFSSPSLQPNGDIRISRDMNNEQAVWDNLFSVLEYRMSRGDFTVIDATASRTKDIDQYKKIAEQYRYRIFIVDFTDVPLEVCLAQNKKRPEMKWVPEDAITNIYNRYRTQKIPKSITLIKPDEFNLVLDKPFDMSQYKKLVFIGDVHGCYDTLMQYNDFKQNNLKDDTAYIFVGDYVDRGNQNAEVMNWLYSIMDLPNVCLLEGNHERWLNAYGNGVEAKSKEFEYKTKPQLIKAGFNEKMARIFYRKLRQFSHMTYNGINILACHAGIPHLNINLLYLPTIDFIKGVGQYKDYLTIAETWMKETKENQFLIHGHRNVSSDETQIADRVFNLEGKVEFGGALRIVELNDKLEWNIIELNDVQPITNLLNTETRHIETVEEAVAYLRNNRFVKERELGDNISSFNFTREAFYNANWNKQTILARGLFIDTDNNKIMARSYEKFFRVDEVEETKLLTLQKEISFPVQVYLKENGFLAIVSYDYNKDRLFIASKSTNKGPYVEYIKNQLIPYEEKLLNLLREKYKAGEYVTFIFECIDIENDPHIIKYEKSELVLLDIIKNTVEYEPLSYEQLQKNGEIIGCKVKEKAFEIKEWETFEELYNKTQEEDYMYNGQYIEGFIFTDAKGFMTKCKAGYYNTWKKMRGVADQALKNGRISKPSILKSALENIFYGFCVQLYNENNIVSSDIVKKYNFKTDIISLRDKFYGDKGPLSENK